MIQKNEFIKLIEDFQKYTEIFSKLYELKIDIINSDLHEYPCKLFEYIINKSFNKSGQDWISYYLYEIPFLGKNPEIKDENGNKISLENLDDLWNLVKDERI